MQNMAEKFHPGTDCIHHRAETSSNSKIIAKNYKKCHKRRRRNQCNFSEICVQGDKLHNVNDLIKPCSVILTKLNLLSHNGNKLSNCLTFSEMNIIEESVTNKKVGRLELGCSMVENKVLNSSGRNDNSVKKQMDLLYKRLCETFRLLRAKEKKMKRVKKVNHNVSFPCSAEKQGMIYASTGLIDNLYQGKKQITKACNQCIASNSKTKCNKKSENVFNKNTKVRFEIRKKHAVQKNLKEAAKNYPFGKELWNKNTVSMLNCNIKSIRKDDITLVEKNGIPILGNIIERNLDKTTKEYQGEKSILSSKKNLYGRENKCLEDADSVKTKECNNIPTVIREESNSNVLQMDTVNKQETRSSISSAGHSISAAKIDKISNRSTTSEFTVSDDQALKYLKRTPLIKHCCVVIDKLPVDKIMKFINPAVMQSLYHENASCPVVRDGNGSCNLEGKCINQFSKSFCSASSDPTISSTNVDEIPNTNDDNSAFNDIIKVHEMAVKDDDSVIIGIPVVDDDVSVSDEIPDVDDAFVIDEIPDVDDDIPVIDGIPDLEDDFPVFNECIACNRIPLIPMNDGIGVPRIPSPNLGSCFILMSDIKHKLSAEEYSKYFIPLKKD